MGTFTGVRSIVGSPQRVHRRIGADFCMQILFCGSVAENPQQIQQVWVYPISENKQQLIIIKKLKKNTILLSLSI